MATDTQDRIRDFGLTAVDVYEKGWKSLADVSERTAESTQNELISSVAHAHAQFTRTVTNAYASAARDALTVR